MCRQRPSPACLHSSSVTFDCLYQDYEGFVVSRVSAIDRLPTHHTTYYPPWPCIRCIRPFLSSAKIQHTATHTVFAFGLFSAGGHTTPGILLLPCWWRCRSRDAVMQHFLSLPPSLVLSHAARFTQVHLSCDPMLRGRSVDVWPDNSPATLPRAMHTQLTQVICVGICILTAYICVTEASASETRRSESVSRHKVYELTHRTHDLRYFYPVSSRIIRKNTTTVAWPTPTPTDVRVKWTVRRDGDLGNSHSVTQRSSEPAVFFLFAY